MILALLAFTPWLVAPELQGKSVTIGLRKQLFVDDYIVANRTNITRTPGQVTRPTAVGLSSSPPIQRAGSGVLGLWV
jgi:hypothetical protein